MFGCSEHTVKEYPKNKTHFINEQTRNTQEIAEVIIILDKQPNQHRQHRTMNRQNKGFNKQNWFKN